MNNWLLAIGIAVIAGLLALVLWNLRRLLARPSEVQPAADQLSGRLDSLGRELSERLIQLQSGQDSFAKVSDNLNSLQQILSGNQSRGRFGEMQLKLILQNALGENSGLYEEQYVIREAKGPGEKGEVRPDAVVRLPYPQTLLCIDSKFPFSEYRRLFEGNLTPEQSEAAEKEFEKVVRGHFKTVQGKYVIPGKTADYALLFIPNDGIFAHIHGSYGDLVEEYRQKGVILTSPATMQAILATVSLFWREVRRNEQSAEIKRELNALKQLFDKFYEEWKTNSSKFLSLYTEQEKLQKSFDKVKGTFDRIADADLKEEAGSGADQE